MQTSYKTKGDLTKDKLKYNKHGKIVSKKKSGSNPIKRLHDAGYFTHKGKFGSFKKGSKTRKARKSAEDCQKRQALPSQDWKT